MYNKVFIILNRSQIAAFVDTLNKIVENDPTYNQNALIQAVLAKVKNNTTLTLAQVNTAIDELNLDITDDRIIRKELQQKFQEVSTVSGIAYG